MALQEIKSFIDYPGLKEYDVKIKALLQAYKDDSKEYTDTEIDTLENTLTTLIEALPEVAYKTIKVGATSISSTTKEDTLTLSAGVGISLSGVSSTKTITISSTAIQNISASTDTSVVGTGNVITSLKLSEDGTTIIPYRGITALQLSNVVNKNVTLAYGESSTIATIGGKSITLTLPASSVENHYAPVTDATLNLDAEANSNVAATWGETSLLTGVTLSRDKRGHIMDLTFSSIKLPTSPLGLLKKGSGILITSTSDGKTIGHSNSVIAGTSSEGGSSRAVNFNGSFNIPTITYDSEGHITNTSSTSPITLTLPNIQVGGTNLGTSLLNLVAGTNISLANTNGKVTIGVTGLKALAYQDVIDASKITTGTIDIERLPQAALERCVVVTNDTARLALTKNEVQTGDTVKVTSTNKMYMVVDDSTLGEESAFTEYVTTAAWSTITGKPSTVGGYGITDAYTKTQTDEAISTAIGDAIAASY